MKNFHQFASHKIISQSLEGIIFPLLHNFQEFRKLARYGQPIYDFLNRPAICKLADFANWPQHLYDMK